MKPICMKPAYRFGSMTPWGGNSLHRLYGRELPDEVCGESLEVSVIPGLESRSPEGDTLPQLIARYGEELTGKGFDKEFPLLLKLLSAKSKLSVQVHPDDAYARLHEGKLGKTEAWVILDAQPGAQLCYGLKDGTSTAQLSEALLNGGDVEALIQTVPVHPGDVFYMPSGMVHAIGGGITLYEIQQSSDVTYRLWDYHRKDAQGRERPLHIQQSLDVIKPELKGQQACFPEEAGNQLYLLLDEPAFCLAGLGIDGEIMLPREDSFGILTVLNPLRLCLLGIGEDSGEMQLSAGETVLVPATAPQLSLCGRGRALFATPGRKA